MERTDSFSTTAVSSLCFSHLILNVISVANNTKQPHDGDPGSLNPVSGLVKGDPWGEPGKSRSFSKPRRKAGAKGRLRLGRAALNRPVEF